MNSLTFFFYHPSNNTTTFVTTLSELIKRREKKWMQINIYPSGFLRKYYRYSTTTTTASISVQACFGKPILPSKIAWKSTKCFFFLKEKKERNNETWQICSCLNQHTTWILLQCILRKLLPVIIICCRLHTINPLPPPSINDVFCYYCSAFLSLIYS